MGEDVQIKNSVALVTGGTSGIGYELARLLAKDGYNLILASRNMKDLGRVAKDLKQEFGVEVYTKSKDLFDVGVEHLTNLIGDESIHFNSTNIAQFAELNCSLKR